MNEEFECLNQTPYEKRILHFDAANDFIENELMVQHYNNCVTTKDMLFFRYVSNQKRITKNFAILNINLM